MTTSPPTTPATSAVTSVASAALSIGSLIGRYFNLTSAIPALLLVAWSYALLASGAATGRPELSLLADAFSFSPEKLTGLVLATIFVGLFIHPLQFGTTRLLEGYWGRTTLALGTSAVRINQYRQRKRRLIDRALLHEQRLFTLTAEAIPDTPDPNEVGLAAWRKAMLDDATLLLQTKEGDKLIFDMMGKQEALRKSSEYPDDDRIMPTLLGNALRTFEDSAGRQYGLDTILTAPHFVLVSDPRHVEYVEDGRQAMDVSIRLCLISLLATTEAIALLLTDGPWLLVALVPYLLAYLAYRGAVSAAREYGVALSTMIDLNRFALYEAMQLWRPTDLRSEVQQNRKMKDLLESKPVTINYRPDAPSAALPNPLRSKGSGRR